MRLFTKTWACVVGGGVDLHVLGLIVAMHIIIVRFIVRPEPIRNIRVRVRIPGARVLFIRYRSNSL
jgi:hypothetical protein